MKHLKSFLLLLLALPVLAALPPQTSEELESQAGHVVLGKVVNITSQVVPVKNGLNRAYKIEVSVDTVEKGDLSSGQIVEVHCKKTLRRPNGWAGPQGQNSIPKKDESVRIYLRRTQEGRLEILEPNGWEPLKK